MQERPGMVTFFVSRETTAPSAVLQASTAPTARPPAPATTTFPARTWTVPASAEKVLSALKILFRCVHTHSAVSLLFLTERNVSAVEYDTQVEKILPLILF